MTTNEAKPQSALKRLFREPLLQFLFFGLCIFIAAEWLESRRQNDAATIRIDANLQSYLQNLYNAQFGYQPSPDILRQLIDNHITEEVLFREALQVGLAREDEIIRRRLIQKMEYLILDSEIQAQAPDGALQSWYENHLEDYQLPARVTFKHIYFEDKNEETPAKDRALAALANTDKGRIKGDRFPLQNEYSQLSPNEAAQLFGRTEFSSRLFTDPVGSWQGPWQSGYGYHLVLIENRTEPVTQNFEQVQDQVFTAWQKADQQQRFDDAIAERKKSYNIVWEIDD